jgi:hypothetical protein
VSFILNEYDIDEAYERLSRLETIYRVDLPNLKYLAEVLYSFKVWVNAHSDGWPYWRKPTQAAVKLQRAIDDVLRTYPYNDGKPTDVTVAEVKKILTPVKSFLTRQGASFDHIALPMKEQA